ncbi:beta-galactosidase/arabinogalactan endo-1,4-beta-galactosidase, partial [Desulforamulus putei DSM 12395]
GTGEDGTTGDDTTGDDTAGDGTTGDDTAGDDTKPFSITAKGDLDRSSGIKATVNVDRISAASDHDGNEVVIFQLMKGNEPVSIVALEKDIQSPEGLTAHFNVDGSDNNYWVKVFVFDEFNSDTNSVQTNLAQALELGKN